TTAGPPPRTAPHGVPLTLAERTTTYTYYPDNDIASRKKKLQTVTGPSTAVGSPTTTYTYDAVGGVRTTTDQEGYVLTFDYDVLERLTKTTYPDGTYEETAYNRLDPRSSGGRPGRVPPGDRRSRPGRAHGHLRVVRLRKHGPLARRQRQPHELGARCAGP